MRLIGKSVIVAAAAAGFCIAAAAGSASALPADYTVSPAGTTAITASSGTNTLVFQDATPGHTNAKLTCAPVGTTAAFNGSGSAIGGGHSYFTAPPSDPAATLATATLGSTAAPCKNALVGNVTVTLSGFPWSLGCTLKTASGCNGFLFGVTAHLAATGCSLDASGRINGAYNNTGSFVGNITSGLTVGGVTGALCSAIPVANGDVAYLSGTINISPAMTIS